MEQGDGNLVVYSASNQAVWKTGTMISGTVLVVQSEGNVVEYGGPGAIWASSWHRTRGQSASYNLASDSSQCTFLALEYWTKAQDFYPRLSGNAGDWTTRRPRTAGRCTAAP